MSSGDLKDFYHGKTIFLTGTTGFIGRLILAKLLRLGNVKEVLLLSRPKKGKSNDERFNEILSGFLFQEMEKFDANFRSKLRIVNGDMVDDSLGISLEDRKYLKENAEIVVHGAATVRFDEKLQDAVAINVFGTRNMLELATTMKKLKSFVHISTAYSQCPYNVVAETFYKPAMDYRKILEVCEKLDDYQINSFTDQFITPWPNTYTFTKAISEDMVRQYENRLPIGVIRPTIVQSTIKDPVPGFIDKLIGPVGLAVALTAGLMRIVKTDPKIATDLIPADIVVNSTLAIAREVSKNSTKGKAEVYNCAIGNIRKVSISWALTGILRCSKNRPTKQMIWAPLYNETSSDILHRIYFFLYHYIPAFFIDIVLKCKGSKLRLMKIYSKIFFQVQLLDFFMSRSWEFEDDKMRRMYNEMSDKDHEDFPVRLGPEEYETHVIKGTEGLMKYFFKESEDDAELARKRLTRLNALHNFFLVSVYGLLFYVFVKLF